MSNRLWWIHREDLAPVSGEDLKSLQGAMHTAHYAEGKTVYSFALPGDVMYLVQRGTLRISEQTPAGFWRTIDTLRPGAFFGSLSLIEEGLKKGRVVCEDEVTLLVMRKGSFEKLMRFFPDTGVRWVSFLENYQHQHMHQNSQKSLSRLTRRLWRLLNHYLDHPAYQIEGENLPVTCDLKALALQLAAPPHVIEEALQQLEAQQRIYREDRMIFKGSLPHAP